MNDLEQRLADLHHRAPTEPTSTTVSSDLTRGRDAWRDRRTRRARVVSLGGLVALGAAAAITVGIDAHAGSTSAPQARPAPTTSHPASPASPESTTHPRSHGTSKPPATPRSSIRLVAYRGPQQVGFHVGYIPQGFVLQGADNISLAVARPDDHTGIFNFAHKIVVSVQTVATHGPLDPNAQQITVQGSPGTIETKPDGTMTIYYELPHQRLAFVQAWNDVGIDQQQFEQFANSLTISDDVETVS